MYPSGFVFLVRSSTDNLVSKLQLVTFWIMFTNSASTISFFWDSPIWSVVVCHRRCFTESINLELLSYKDFLHPLSSSKSSTRPIKVINCRQRDRGRQCPLHCGCSSSQLLASLSTIYVIVANFLVKTQVSSSVFLIQGNFAIYCPGPCFVGYML